ncbi:MAG: hypothetical protein SGILL_008389, partial [Bacillariaceae sp.]
KFLQSDMEGPINIVVGGGVKNSRKLANDNPQSFLPDGYSAEIQSTKDVGSSASVIVKKTRHLYIAKAAEYDARIAELKDVQAKIASFDGEAFEPPAKRARAETHAWSCNMNGNWSDNT